MSIPLFDGGPIPEVPLTHGQVDDDFTFVLRRFRRDLQRAIRSAMGDEEIPVVFGMAHSGYMDEAMQAFGLEAFLESQTKESTNPAVAITSISFAENRVDYNASPVELATTVVLPSGEVVAATKHGNPINFYDLRMAVRVYHRDQWQLTRLFRAFLRHFKRHPYLFIPLDRTKPDGDAGQDVSLMIARYYRGEDISDQGYVVEQMVNFEAEVGAFTSRPNSDNLFSADASVVLGLVPMSDDIDLGTLADIRRIQLDLLEKDDPLEIVQATITLPEEES